LRYWVFGTLIESARTVAEAPGRDVGNMRFVKPLDETRDGARSPASATSRSKETPSWAVRDSGVGELLASQGVQLPLHISAYPTLHRTWLTDTCLASAASTRRARREYRGLVALHTQERISFGARRLIRPTLRRYSLNASLICSAAKDCALFRRRQDRGATEEIMRHTLVLLARDLTFACFKAPPACPIAPQRVICALRW